VAALIANTTYTICITWPLYHLIQMCSIINTRSRSWFIYDMAWS